MSDLKDLGKEAASDVEQTVEEVSEENATKPWFKRLSLTTWIFIALALGVVVGLCLQGNPEIATEYIKPLGTIFLNLIKMIVVPLVIFSMIAGVISLSDIRRVGAIGGKTIVYYLCTTACAIIIGLVVANIGNVGGGYSLSTDELSYTAKEAPSFIETIVNIFPDNFVQPMSDASMLQIIVIALFFGFGILAAGKKAQPVADFVNGMSEVCIKIMHMIISIAPFGVFGLITPVVASNGPDILLPLLKLIVIAYIAMILHMVIVYSGLVRIIAKMRPIQFFKGQMQAMVFAFASASSVGTLPVNMECSKKLGVSQEVSSFVLPLGATINMDGTAIYQGVCAIFIAQVFGIELDLSQQMVIVMTAVLSSIGTAGVPGSGMIMLAMVLQSVGLPVEGIALVAGVDRVLDMMRTTVNITGDQSAAVCVNAMEQKKLLKRAAKESKPSRA